MSESGRSAAPSNGGPGLDREPSHPFVKRLWRALREDFGREMNTTLRVAVMLADGLPREQVAARLGLSRPEVEEACARIDRICEKLTRDAESAPRMERDGVTS
jgi:hypothetical protein